MEMIIDLNKKPEDSHVTEMKKLLQANFCDEEIGYAFPGIMELPDKDVPVAVELLKEIGYVQGKDFQLYNGG